MENDKNGVQVENSTKMESLDRISKLPVVESTMNAAHEVYDKIKDSHAIVNTVLTTAEATIKQAAGAAQPIATKLEGPIKKVDSLLCTSLDYVEEKMPSIKLPPGEMYESAKEGIKSTVGPAVSSATALADYGKQKVTSMATSYSQGSTTNGTESKKKD